MTRIVITSKSFVFGARKYLIYHNSVSQGNGFGDDGSTALAPALAHLVNLKTLNLSGELGFGQRVRV